MNNKTLAILIHGKKTYVRGVGHVTVWAEMPKPSIVINGEVHEGTEYFVLEVPEHKKLCYYFIKSGR